MKAHYPGCMSDEECRCQDYDNEREEQGVCPECLNATPKTSPLLDYDGAIKVLECVASDYEYRAKIYGNQPGVVCGNLAGYERSKAEACRAAILAITPYLTKLDQ